MHPSQDVSVRLIYCSTITKKNEITTKNPEEKNFRMISDLIVYKPYTILNFHKLRLKRTYNNSMNLNIRFECIKESY